MVVERMVADGSGQRNWSKVQMDASRQEISRNHAGIWL